MSKENKTKIKQKVNWKKELSLLPGYIIVLVWIIFTAALLLDSGGQPFHIQGNFFRYCFQIRKWFSFGKLCKRMAGAERFRILRKLAALCGCFLCRRYSDIRAGRLCAFQI